MTTTTPLKIGDKISILKIFDTNTGLDRSTKLSFNGILKEVSGDFLLLDCGYMLARVNVKHVVGLA